MITKMTFCTCLVVLWWTFQFPAEAQVPMPRQFTLFDGEKVFWADGSRGPFPISDRAIEQDSEQVWVNGRLFLRDRDYVVDTKQALLTLLQDIVRGAEVVVRFRQRPVVIDGVVRRRALPRNTGPEDHPVAKVYTLPVGNDVVDVPGLTVGGHKSVALTVGSQHAVNQALQLRISGEVAKGIDLLAVLSDRNLPIGESGGSRRLQELDRVFFQVRSGQVLATLGDLDVSFDGSVFGRYRRQLQGGYVSAHRDESQVTAFGAVSRGQWNTARLVAVEGYQGPYRLSNGGFSGQVVPESERVYLNGRLLKRGDRLDYTVDYDRGQVVFAPEVPIGADSRITVEFQVVENGKQSRLMGLESRMNIAEGLSLGTTLIRESDRPVLAGVASPGLVKNQRQLGVLQAAYTPLVGLHIRGEAALSDQTDGGGRAFRVDGGWVVDNVEIKGRFRQIGAHFEAFERLDRGDAAGRWGWEADSTRVTQREGEVTVRYGWRDFAIIGEYGRRLGLVNTGRTGVGVYLPLGTYRYESLGRARGNMTRHEGDFDIVFGIVKPGFHFSLENGSGDGVGSSSLFYALGPRSLPQGINKRELAWQIAVGEGRSWVWESELKYRHFRQREIAWQDSLRGWSHTHRAQVKNWKGWVFSGAYTQGTMQIGRERRQHTHLGRVRLGHSRPGLSHQITYRVSSTGVQVNRPIFVDVAPGLGDYIWEDVNGDGVQDFEEFVPDIDGDYVQVFDTRSNFDPARDGALGMRLEVDFRRLIGNDNWLSALAVDASLRADRQISAGAQDATPWALLGFESGAGVLGGHRDALVRLYLFRYHRRGSLRLTGRVRNQVNRAFYSGAVELLTEGSLLGKMRSERRAEWEAELNWGRRERAGAGAFAYGVETATADLRAVLRPGSKWQLRLGGQAGRDWEGVRALSVIYSAVQPEVLYALPGRGRLRAELDWTRVWATQPIPLFLGMARGNRPGQNWVWRLGLDYRVGQYVTAQLMYDGRKRPDRTTIHLGRMQMRAAF